MSERTYTLTTQQAATRLGVPRQRVVNWERRGYLTCERLANGHRRFDAAEVEALAATLDRAPGRWARLPRSKRPAQPERGDDMDNETECWTGQTLVAAATEAAQRRERSREIAAVNRLRRAVELILYAKPGTYPVDMDGGVPVAMFDGWRFRIGPDRDGRWTLRVAAPCACWRLEGYPWAKAEIYNLADLGDLLDGREPNVHTCEAGR